jgi:hypothetical protein
MEDILTDSGFRKDGASEIPASTCLASPEGTLLSAQNRQWKYRPTPIRERE